MNFTVNEEISSEIVFEYEDGVTLHILKRGEPTVSIAPSREDMTKLFVLWLRCMDWELDFLTLSFLENRIKLRQLKKS